MLISLFVILLGHLLLSLDSDNREAKENETKHDTHKELIDMLYPVWLYRALSSHHQCLNNLLTNRNQPLSNVEGMWLSNPRSYCCA